LLIYGCSSWKKKSMLGILCRLVFSSSVYNIWYARNAIRHGHPYFVISIGMTPLQSWVCSVPCYCGIHCLHLEQNLNFWPFTCSLHNHSTCSFILVVLFIIHHCPQPHVSLFFLASDEQRTKTGEVMSYFARLGLLIKIV